MTEPDARIEFDQSGLDRRRRSFSPDRELLGGSPNQQGFAHGVGGRQLQQTPGVVRKRVELPAEALLDVPREPDRAGQPEATRELRRRQAPYQLQQRQRVAPRLGHDLVTDPRVQGPGEHSVQQDRARRPHVRPSTTSSGNPARSSLGFRAANTKPIDSASRRRATNANTCAEARSSHCSSSTRQISGRSSAASDSRLRTARPTRKRSGARPAAHAERRRQRIALRDRESLEMIKRRRAHLMQPGERKLHLRLDAHGARDPEVRRLLDDVLQQRGLAHPGLAAQHQGPALSRSNGVDQPVEHIELAAPAR